MRRSTDPVAEFKGACFYKGGRGGEGKGMGEGKEGRGEGKGKGREGKGESVPLALILQLDHWSQVCKVLLHYAQNLRNYAAFNRDNLTF